jgi:myosin-5
MEPHYVRCVKPNGLNQPGLFENSNALHQLRCGGEPQLLVPTHPPRLVASPAACSGHRIPASTSCRRATIYTKFCADGVGCWLVAAAAGVLEAVRISCAGFPSKRPFPDFVDHFWSLAPELYHREDLDDR